jgi:hypothetical protein
LSADGGIEVNWARLGRYVIAILAVTLSVLMIAGLLNLTGDCAYGVRDCGGGARRFSFAVLGAGMLALAYLIYRYLGGPRSTS